MSFEVENGYIPLTIEEIIGIIRENINQEFNLNYTVDSFVGTNWYKFAYAVIQELQKNEVKTSEIFNKLQSYISLTNEKIQRPSVSSPGLIESFESQGFTVSVKPNELADAGTISIAVDLESDSPDYPQKKLEACTLVKEFVAGGIISQGTEMEVITLSNGQSFEFRFFLPERIPVKLRMTLEVSENNLLTIPSDEDIRQEILENIRERYRLGWNFEPQRYFTLNDALWAGSAVLEYSTDDGATWESDIFNADFKELFTFGLEDIQVIIN